MFFVPAVSLFIVGRHVYLSAKHDLSTWKGGGMGMFADTDSIQNRYAKVFVVGPDGNRNAVTQFNPEQVELVNRALEYPVRENFLRAARWIAQENWTATHQRVPVTLFDVNGEPVGTARESFYSWFRTGDAPVKKNQPGACRSNSGKSLTTR